MLAPDGLFFARLASNIGLERSSDRPGTAGAPPGRHGTLRGRRGDAARLDRSRLGGEMLDPHQDHQRAAAALHDDVVPAQARTASETSRVALTATIYNVDIDLADADRGVYETLALRVARHPSESEEYLVTRILAYTLEFREGIAFSSGLSDPDEPAISVRDLTGAIQSWIDIGIPDAARLHKASKAAPRVVVYTHKDPAQLVNRLSGERIHRVEALEVYAIDRRLVGALALDGHLPGHLYHAHCPGAQFVWRRPARRPGSKAEEIRMDQR